MKQKSKSNENTKTFWGIYSRARISCLMERRRKKQRLKSPDTVTLIM